MRYAQEYSGQKLHLVRELDLQLDGRHVSFTALCGRQPIKRGEWRMTINVPLKAECKNCRKALRNL